RVEAAARGDAEVAQPVKKRDVAVDLMPEQRLVLRAPAPLAHIGAVALDEQGEPVVERSPERLAAAEIGSARRIAPRGMVAHQRHEGCRRERTLLLHRRTGLVLD